MPCQILSSTGVRAHRNTAVMIYGSSRSFFLFDAKAVVISFILYPPDNFLFLCPTELKAIRTVIIRGTDQTPEVQQTRVFTLSAGPFLVGDENDSFFLLRSGM